MQVFFSPLRNLPYWILAFFYLFSCFFGGYLLVFSIDVKTPNYPLLYRFVDESLFLLAALVSVVAWKFSFEKFKEHILVFSCALIFIFLLCFGAFTKERPLEFQDFWILKNSLYGVLFFLFTVLFPQSRSEKVLRIVFYCITSSLIASLLYTYLFFPAGTFEFRVVGTWTNPNALGFISNFLIAVVSYLFYRKQLSWLEYIVALFTATFSILFSLSFSALAQLICLLTLGFLAACLKRSFKMFAPHLFIGMFAFLAYSNIQASFRPIAWVLDQKISALKSQLEPKSQEPAEEIKKEFTTFSSRQKSFNQAIKPASRINFLFGQNQSKFTETDSSLLNFFINFGAAPLIFLLFFFGKALFDGTKDFFQTQDLSVAWMTAFLASFLVFNFPFQYQFEKYPTNLFIYFGVSLLILGPFQEQPISDDKTC